MLLYAKEAKNAQTIARYGGGAPSDWLERHVYTVFPGLGMRYPSFAFRIGECHGYSARSSSGAKAA